MLFLLAYGAMVVAQTRGGWLIEMFHGREARVRAESPEMTKDVQPDASMEALCAGYDAAHYEPLSNVFHSAGMLTVLLSLGLGVFFALSGKLRPLSTALIWTPPLWYLPAWLGHFWRQADIPAVFTYGTTLAGWVSGEWCAVRSMFAGRTISAPWELTLCTVLVVILSTLLLRPALSASGAHLKSA
mmetsp:Transcript_108640/g.306244  ORF Transcript_108640/g.306244 Transcript_108640/m.306244 type:complete len:186 (+) Transcript_108640:52-609(+)